MSWTICAEEVQHTVSRNSACVTVQTIAIAGMLIENLILNGIAVTVKNNAIRGTRVTPLKIGGGDLIGFDQPQVQLNRR